MTTGTTTETTTGTTTAPHTVIDDCIAVWNATHPPVRRMPADRVRA